jgi:hypothetical protein
VAQHLCSRELVHDAREHRHELGRKECLRAAPAVLALGALARLLGLVDGEADPTRPPGDPLAAGVHEGAPLPNLLTLARVTQQRHCVDAPALLVVERKRHAVHTHDDVRASLDDRRDAIGVGISAIEQPR